MKKKLLGLFYLTSFGTVFADEGVAIANPLEGSGITSIGGLLEVIISGVTYVAIPVIVLAFIWAGFKFVSAQGNSSEISKARSVFLYTLAGAAIILGSNVILEVVVNTSDKLLTP